MAQIQLDMSGIKGLALRYYGDKPYTASSPNLRYLGVDGQMAEGIYNPISALGYMSPANDTVKAVTGTTPYLLTSAIVIPQRLATTSTDAIFFSDEAVTGTTGKIVNLDTAIDTSLDATRTIASFTTIVMLASMVAATDVFTVSSGTLTGFGVVSGGIVRYLLPTFGGLTQNTNYYVGSVVGNTFKLYTDVGLSSLVDITENVTDNELVPAAYVYGATQYTKSEDFILYQLNGVPKIYYTRKNTTTDGSADAIGIANTDFSSPDDDWSISLPTGATTTLEKLDTSRTIFVLADNGFLYVLNGNNVHKIDGGTTGGTNGTLTPRVLTFLGSPTTGGTGTISHLIDGIDIRGKMWIGLHVNSSFSTRTSSISGKTFNQFVGVYVWNRSSTSASMQDFIPIIGAKEIKSLCILQGQPACFTISNDGYTQLRMWNGTEFKIVQTLGSNAYPVYRKHSIHENGDSIMWFGNDGKIYFYGMPETGLSNALYILGDMSLHVTNGQTYSGSGVFIAANATESVTAGNQTSPLAFYLSYSDTAGNFLKKWYPYSTETVATVAQLGHTGTVYTLVRHIPDMSTVKYVDIRCAPTGTGTTVIATVKYYFNGSATASITKSVTKDQASRGYVRHDLNKPYINSVQISVDFSTSNTLSSTADFRPSIAIIDYEQTTTKG